jgi:pyrroline-5-carboxylate reductase
MSLSSKIGFWGTGNMAKAIIRGLITNEVFHPDQISCISRSGESAAAFAKETGVKALGSHELLINECDYLVLAFKPFQLEDLAVELGDIRGNTVLSILAGTKLEKLVRFFPNARSIIRTMPNTPGRIGEGITAYCTASPLLHSERAELETVLASLGEVVEINEALMDVFTAVAGSGPAYVFEFIAALAEAGEQEGLPSEMALSIAKQTVFGAAALAKKAKEHPDELRNQVTSKGGTTAAGLSEMTNGHFRKVISNTVKAAKDRSIEMGR